PAGSTSFSEQHSYASTGSYPVSATIGDSEYSNDLLYGSTGNTATGQLYVFDLSNGNATLVGNLPGANVTEIVTNPANGQAWLEYGNNQFKGQQFNINTGAAIGSVVSNVTHQNFNGMTYINGVLYATGTPSTGGASPSTLYTLDPTTGTATAVA